MQFEVSNLYHIYNRGNNKQPIFFNRDNYLYFLTKVKKHIQPNCDILAWCLMPNHFHFLLHANIATVKIVKENPIEINALTEGIRLLLSSYTQGINKQNNTTGNLFQQKTKSKCITDGDKNYGYTTFQYTHQNPFKANLVRRLEDWEFSSFADYAGLRNGRLCNKALAFSLFAINEKTFLSDSYKELPDDLLKKIF
ncbi:transposase [Ferruginibacter sp. SUN106]|uniref:transposase n=1 Tax=Ferruginibacter sp. SUN106 TaxID=2978348 RepID=UPI003D36058C